MQNQDGCDLLIPHKKWANNEQEFQNYLELERWAKRLKDCNSCTCSIETGVLNFSLPDNTFTQKNRPTTAVKCGTTVSSHLLIVNMGIVFDGNAAGVRDVYVIGNGDSQTAYGTTVPGVVGLIDGTQRMNITRTFPAHVNTLSPKYFITLQQNSGVALNVQIEVTEYYPCCDCDWAFPC
jgi:hypothetical protein